MSLPRLIQRNKTPQLSVHVGRPGEMAIDTDKNTIVLFDGETAGGVPLAKESHQHESATSTMPGFMSISDKSKLDALSAAVYFQIMEKDGTPLPSRNIINYDENFVLTDQNGKINVSLKPVATPGDYIKVSVDEYGRVVKGAALQANDLPQIPLSKIPAFSSAIIAQKISDFQPAAANLDMAGNTITNLKNPVAVGDAVTKGYVDTLSAGISFKKSCHVATTGNINLSMPGSAFDSIALSTNDRVLVKNQTLAKDNGIYVWTAPDTPLVRASDADESSKLSPGSLVYVSEGAINGGISWVQSENSVNLGNLPITFVEYQSAPVIIPGEGLSKDGNVLSVQLSEDFSYEDGGIRIAPKDIEAGDYNSLVLDERGQIVAATKKPYLEVNELMESIRDVKANGIIVKTGSGTVATRSIVSDRTIGIHNIDGREGNIRLAQIPNSTVQKINVLNDGQKIGTRSAINFKAGMGSVLEMADVPEEDQINVTIISNNSSSAPVEGTYITLSSNPVLPNERFIQQGPGIKLTDNGPGNALVIEFDGDMGTL